MNNLLWVIPIFLWIFFLLFFKGTISNFNIRGRRSFIPFIKGSPRYCENCNGNYISCPEIPLDHTDSDGSYLWCKMSENDQYPYYVDNQGNIECPFNYEPYLWKECEDGTHSVTKGNSPPIAQPCRVYATCTPSKS